MPYREFNRLSFELQKKAEGSSARACRFKTLHNEVLTPVFMPVATFAALRTQNTMNVAELEFPVLLANTYHLLLRPGTEVFKKFGGIHSFMNWKKSVLTDSGGFQIFSLSKALKMTEEGASFKSYLDGKDILLSPEVSIATQLAIGSDIMMALDQCVPSTSDIAVSRDAVDITARWAERSLAARGKSPQSLFGIIQGACYPDLRKISAAQITSLPFDGFAIGGLAVGEGEDERKDMTELTAALLPHDRPRYLMGVGTPLDLLEAVHRGVDMFDCIMPTALAHQGVAYTSMGRIELRRGVHKFSERPLDENCGCPACANYSRAYLHHLIKTGEYFGSNLVGLHNLKFYRDLMASMRKNIIEGTFVNFYSEQKERLKLRDEENPAKPPKRRRKNEASKLGNYEVVEQNGFFSIKHTDSGEIMHSVMEPMEEAKTLYIDQSRLAEGLYQAGDFIIWDVGLGAGTNAMAAIFEAERLHSEKPFSGTLKIISFEKDMDSMKLALKNPSRFPQVRHPAPAGLIKNGSWKSGSAPIEWILMEGDFFEKAPAAPHPDCIFYDPFSLNTESEMWSFSAFEMVFSLCGGKNARLFTYSSSTRVRSALLAAGFFVGKGAGTGPRTETTIAVKAGPNDSVLSGIELLGKSWLDRFDRSSSKVSESLSEDEKSLIIARVKDHPQFKMY